MLTAATNRITTLVRTLAIDAVPGAKHRPGWTKGGKGRADESGKQHEQWQLKAEAIWHKHPEWSKTRVAKKIAPDLPRQNGQSYSISNICKYIHKPQYHSSLFPSSYPHESVCIFLTKCQAYGQSLGILLSEGRC
jgi:hypothetical protein